MAYEKYVKEFTDRDGNTFGFMDKDGRDLIDSLRDSVQVFERGNLYVPSTAILGYLDSNGDIVTGNTTATKRVTFNEYVEMAFPCYLYVDAN